MNNNNVNCLYVVSRILVFLFIVDNLFNCI